MNEDSRKNGVVGTAIDIVGTAGLIGGTGYGIHKVMNSEMATKIMNNGKVNEKQGLRSSVIEGYRNKSAKVGAWINNAKDEINDLKKTKDVTKENVKKDSKFKDYNVIHSQEKSFGRDSVYSKMNLNDTMETLGDTISPDKTIRNNAINKVRNNVSVEVIPNSGKNAGKSISTDMMTGSMLRGRKIKGGGGPRTLVKSKLSGTIKAVAKAL